MPSGAWWLLEQLKGKSKVSRERKIYNNGHPLFYQKNCRGIWWLLSLALHSYCTLEYEHLPVAPCIPLAYAGYIIFTFVSWRISALDVSHRARIRFGLKFQSIQRVRRRRKPLLRCTDASILDEYYGGQAGVSRPSVSSVLLVFSFWFAFTTPQQIEYSETC